MPRNWMSSLLRNDLEWQSWGSIVSGRPKFSRCYLASCCTIEESETTTEPFTYDLVAEALEGLKLGAAELGDLVICFV